MKKIFIIVEGIADLPSKKFENRTPLELARTPNLDRLAKDGMQGLVKPSSSLCFPGSDTGLISLSGNSPHKNQNCRGYFESLSLDIYDDTRTFFRANLITDQDGVMASYGCPSITDDEGITLAMALNEALKDFPVNFKAVSGFRLNLSVDNDWLFEGKKPILKTQHPRVDMKFILEDHYPKGKPGKKLIALTEAAKEVLQSHDINQVKIDLGENPANNIWLWGNNLPKKNKSFNDFFAQDALMIPGTHLARGIASSLGINSMPVVLPHGDGHKSYTVRLRNFQALLEEHDNIFISVETLNDISMGGDLHRKCQGIESFDDNLLGEILEILDNSDYLYKILVASTHLTPITTSLPHRGASPWVFYGKDVRSDKTTKFNEKEALSARNAYAPQKLLKKTLFAS